MSLDSVYNARILEYAANIGMVGRLDAPDGSAKAHSKLCGSTVIADVRVHDGRVVEFAQDVKACALGQASAGILAGQIIGCSLSQVERARDELRAMLKENGEVPSAPFGELEFLLPVREYRARHASTMLPFDAAVDALRVAEERQAA